MCPDELKETINNGSPSFHKRFKWFSDNIEFITNRVKDGQFNNSKYVEDRYKHIVMFEADTTTARSVSQHELQFDRRRNPLIKFIKVIE